MEIFNKYKKSFFLILVFFIISLFLIKFSMNLVKSEIINIVNSKNLRFLFQTNLVIKFKNLQTKSFPKMSIPSIKKILRNCI